MPGGGGMDGGRGIDGGIGMLGGTGGPRATVAGGWAAPLCSICGCSC